jgi:uncharacterized metal-binding protein
VAGDVDRPPRRVANEQRSNTPRLVAQLTDDLEALGQGAIVCGIDVGNLDRTSTDNSSGSTAVVLGHATMTCVVGVLVEASISIPSSSMATRNPRKRS